WGLTGKAVRQAMTHEPGDLPAAVVFRRSGDGPLERSFPADDVMDRASARRRRRSGGRSPTLWRRLMRLHSKSSWIALASCLALAPPALAQSAAPPAGQSGPSAEETDRDTVVITG